MRAVGQADRGRATRDLLHGHDVRQVAKVGAAVVLRHGQAVHPEFAQLLPEVHRELVAAVDLGGAGRDLLCDELLQGIAQQCDVLAEFELDAG